MRNEREGCIVLNLLSGIGPARVNQLIASFGSVSAIFGASAATLCRIRGMNEELAERILDWPKHADLERELELAEKGGATILTRFDPEYPAMLKEIRDAPLCLYLRGTLPPELSTRSLAVVGTRNASLYGRKMARHLAESAAYSGWVTVSGLAVGIDAVAHRATLDAGGKTVAVLGGGLARLHPIENAPLAREIANSGGAVVTEFPMTFAPTRRTFPMRNRIISGLSLGVLVVEAGLNSGSMITAAHALEQGRRIFAVPGEADHVNANGCNALIRQGAVLVETFEHVVEEFDFLPGLDRGSFRETSSDDDSDPRFAASMLSSLDEDLLAALSAGALTVDELSARTNAAPSDVMSALIALEILHCVRKNPDGTFSKICGS